MARQATRPVPRSAARTGRAVGSSPYPGRARPAPRRSGFATALRKLLAFALLVVLLLTLAAVVYLLQEVPSAAPAKADLMAQAASQRAAWVSIAEVPDSMQQAIIATEDARFYEHHGLDLLGMIRATIANVRAGRPVQGGSTISQQLAKRYLERTDPTAERKLLVLAMTAKLELHYSKADILEMYLNSIYFGPYAYGLDNAARVYFHKPVRELNTAETTLLAGLPQAPSLYDPIHQLARVKTRQAVVIAAMERAGYLTSTEAAAVRNTRTALDP